MRSFLFLLTMGITATIAAQTPQISATETQNAGTALPEGPLLRPAGDFSQWEIVFTYGEDKRREKRSPTPDDTRPVKTLTTKTGRVVHEEQTDSHNRATDTWFNGSLQYYKSVNGPSWFELSPTDTANTAMASSYRPLPSSGFRDVDFIQPANFVGKVPYAKGECLVFTPGGSQKVNISDDAQRQKSLASLDTLAYIDSETRLPVSVKVRGETRVYRFLPPPTEMQTLPPELNAQIKKGQEGRAKLEAPAARPF